MKKPVISGLNPKIWQACNYCIYLWRRLLGVWTCGNICWSWAWINRTSPSKGVGLGSPLVAFSVYGDLTRSVNTVNNFTSVSNYQTHVCLCIWGPYVRLAFVPNMLSFWNKVIIITIIIITFIIIIMAPGRFAQKPVPPGTIRLGRFAPQIFERDCSHKFTGTIRTKLKLLGQITIFKASNQKKYEVQFLSIWMNSFICCCWKLFISWKTTTTVYHLTD